MSKGSEQRPTDLRRFRRNWDRVFSVRRAKERQGDPKPKNKSSGEAKREQSGPPE